MQISKQSQAILIAYNILNKTNAFNEDLIAWNRKPEADKTWDLFQNHFRDAYKQRRSTVNKVVNNTSFGEHHANMIASRVKDQLFQRAFDEEQVPPPPPQMFEPMLQQSMKQQHQANAVVQTNTVNALMNQVQQLNQTIQNMQIQMNNQQNSCNTSSQGNNQNQNQGGRNEGNGANCDRCPKKKYC